MQSVLIKIEYLTFVAYYKIQKNKNILRHPPPMLEQLLNWERPLFLSLNGSECTYLDHFMYLYSETIIWIPLAVFLLSVLLYKKDWRQIFALILAIALTITLCDQFASGFCKPFFSRFRPTHHPDFMEEVKTVLGYRGGLYGFISSHAANAFGFAVLAALIVRSWFFGTSIMLWASITAYTRIYLGVHFISDIVPGAMVGTIFAFIVFYMYKKIGRKHVAAYTTYQKKLLGWGILFNILLLLLLTEPLINAFFITEAN